MGERCRVYRISTEDLDRSVDDPALSLLLSDGWTVIAPIAVEEKNGVSIALILAPPKNEPYQWKLWVIGALVGVIAVMTCVLLLGGQL